MQNCTTVEEFVTEARTTKPRLGWGPFSFSATDPGRSEVPALTAPLMGAVRVPVGVAIGGIEGMPKAAIAIDTAIMMVAMTSRLRPCLVRFVNDSAQDHNGRVS